MTSLPNRNSAGSIAVSRLWLYAVLHDLRGLEEACAPDDASDPYRWGEGVLALALASVISTVAIAQPAPTSNYTSFEATSGKPVQLGYYGSAHKNCTPAPLPVVRVIEAPKSGMLTVRRGELKTDQVAGCPGLKIPAQVVFYQARVGATGSDHLVYEVTNSTGEVTTRRGRARVVPR